MASTPAPRRSYPEREDMPDRERADGHMRQSLVLITLVGIFST
jgi:hypothetical protein